MRKKIGFIAVGQAGGNIGQLFEERGFSVLYLNTAQEDLDTLKNAKHRYHITGGEGCNKDRNKAKQLVIDDFDNIAAKIDETLDCEIMFLIFAAGGGTGSGAGPMLADLLLDDSKKAVGIVTILPAQSESIKSQINAYECFAELVEIPTTSACFIIDNDKGDKMSLNPLFVSAFTEFIEVPEKYKSDKGNIDKAETVEMLKAHGMAVVLRYEDSVMADIIEGIGSNIFAPLEQDRRVKYIAVSCDASIGELSDIQKKVGIPFDVFRAYSEKAHVMLSGLSYPKTRLDVIHSFIQDNKEMIVNNLTSAGIKLENDMDFLNVAASSSAARPQGQKSHRDIMNRYLRKK